MRSVSRTMNLRPELRPPLEWMRQNEPTKFRSVVMSLRYCQERRLSKHDAQSAIQCFEVLSSDISGARTAKQVFTERQYVA